MYRLCHLSCGRDEQTEALYGDVDRDAHACEAEVALPHNGQKGFVQGLHDRQTGTQTVQTNIKRPSIHSNKHKCT